MDSGGWQLFDEFLGGLFEWALSEDFVGEPFQRTGGLRKRLGWRGLTDGWATGRRSKLAGAGYSPFITLMSVLTWRTTSKVCSSVTASCIFSSKAVWVRKSSLASWSKPSCSIQRIDTPC